MKIKSDYANAPQWKELTIKSRLPEELKCLDELAHNMWWAWNYEARDLFRDIDPKLYSAVKHNPVMLLERLGYERKEEIVNDKAMMKRIQAVYKSFKDYMNVKPDATRPSVAYFCMEYGIHSALKIYSGGLGMLAGDYVKEASDSNVDMCAIGFLYRFGYFTQTLSMDGQQIAKYEAQNFNSIPVERVLDAEGNPVVVDVPYTNYQVHASVWVANVGRVKLYLLDTDNDLNSEFDKPITHSLYGGDWENRLKQEILLGIGGMQLLKKLGIKKDIYHCNEGHAALCNLQRLCDYVESGLSFNEAMELVRASSLYTVHTPVPAGHDYFDEGLFGKYMGGYPAKLGISWDEFIGMGRQNPDDHSERFCMSTFACNTCQEVNGVSKLHGWVSQKMFAPIWNGYYPEENHVGYVTNGVHFPTWAATEWKQLYGKYFDKNFMSDQSNQNIWEAIYNVDDEEIWKTRKGLKQKLVDYIRVQFRETWLKNQGDPSRVVSLLESIDSNALIIGFCRRFATYKRAHLLFTDLDRLSKIVNNPERPVKFLFAGKAHPADGAGQGLIKKIYEISQRPEFLGKIIFLEDYDFMLARRLVSGVDIWMNTPTRPLEASGTSGEKAEMNGVVNLSVLDGWWLEGYREGAGWALTEKRTYQNQGHQDQLDAATIYSLLENEIIPMFYNKNKKGYSEEWIQVIKKSIATIAPHYTMKRQLDDYYDRFYCKEAARFKKLSADNNRLAKDIAQWKETVAERWDSIKVVSKENPILDNAAETGVTYKLRYVIDEQGLNDAVGLELVVLSNVRDGGDREVHNVYPFDMVGHEGNLYTFEANVEPYAAGSYRCCVRMFPKNENLPHRQDFCYVKWLD
ncbi:MAG: alpha-glucan family phosphorylase [Prevotella sp.]|uniref:alpha-glucan family phosphorylase n=1 Tax=Prevotella sp. P3-122 TaxID=2024223 RepID=UPI000B961AB5|nr:alpha-glucan family phosphorylase [Prevotella sp. P3-122]MCI6181830.1 alpha-glucan family phosphorylase [Prevotella sp.]MCI6462031.1 alpha-glucan family phosphorylase [Prevotella sp.]MCI7341301.1 alpha-glucan family phosphorylase [Prevotella sp.]MCI7359963.1 alpha-glucan family phosphorylase [Prevotella sp.]MDD6671031.1 alpha-glucan family phosphorylase [Prevotella sp.]